jgi:hypothetical protein
VTGFGRAKAQQIATAQFIERAQQMVLAAQPGFVFGNDRCAIAVDPDPKRIPSFAAAPDVDRIGVAACRVLVEDLAHITLHLSRFRGFPRGATRRGRQQAGAAKGASGTGATRRTHAAEHGEDPPFLRRRCPA